MTEQTEGASCRTGVSPWVVSLEKTGKTQRVHVRIYNMSAKSIKIKPNSDLCELHEVKVLRNIDPIDSKKSKEEQAWISQLHVNQKDQLPEGINLDKSALTTTQKEQLSQFLKRWQEVFSTGISDLGNCDLVQHEIKLTDDEPFKDPYRRIPPPLFQEVKEHLTEMIETNVIRPSKSPYSLNVVIVRKKDGSIRFCVDFRKLNSKTIKDAYAILRVEDSFHILAGAKYFSKPEPNTFP